MSSYLKSAGPAPPAAEGAEGEAGGAAPSPPASVPAFVFGSLRDTGAGGRMIVGVLIGVGYFLLGSTMADSGTVFDLSPFVAAWLPTVLLTTGTLIALRRMS